MANTFREHHLFQFLKRFDQQTKPLDIFLNSYYRDNKALGSKDRRFLSDTIYQLIRWKELYDYLNYGDVSWEKRYSRFLKNEINRHLPPHIRVGSPKELLEIVVSDHGEKIACEVAEISNTEAPVTIRVNPLKIDRTGLLQLLPKELDPTPCSHSCLGIQLAKRAPFSEMKEFKEGLFEVQDEGSQLVSFMLDAKPKEKILDFCAGAGGKTLGFAPFMENKGIVYLHDTRKHALEQAKKRLARAGVFNVQFPTSLKDLKRRMDTVLIDVPCSGTGTYRRNPDLKWKFNRALLDQLKEEQRTIFDEALPFLKQGGKIIYATCSILKEENERQIDYFLKKYPLKLLGDPFSSFPTTNGMDGFFAQALTYK